MPTFSRVPTAMALAALAGGASAAVTFPAVFALSSINGANGFRLLGVRELDHAGVAVASAGDLNADGAPDFVIGAAEADVGNLSGAGSTYVIFGRPASVPAFPASVNLAALSGADGFRLDGFAANSLSGHSLAGALDINHDGIDDLVIGAPHVSRGADLQTGAVFFVYGRNTATSGPFPPALDLNSLNGANGFRLEGQFALTYTGQSVAAPGDVNGDGIDDALIGVRSGGSAFVVFGRDTAASGPFPSVWSVSALSGSNGARLDGLSVSVDILAVDAAGDLNGDGARDMLVGAPQASPEGRATAGSTFVVYGRAAAASAFPGVITLAALNGADGFRIDGVADGDFSGAALCSAGDINHDGHDDIGIGAILAQPGGQIFAGSAFVLFGRDTAASGAFPAAIALASLDGTNGFRLDGAASSDFTGSLAPGGDINRDGVDDLLIGAPYASPGGRVRAGSTYALFGRGAAAFPATIALASLDGATGFRIDGASPHDESGVAMAFIADINGDHHGDLLIGATGLDPQGAPHAGGAYVILNAQIAPCPGDTNGDQLVNFADLNTVLSEFGASGAALPGDVNHDGVVNFADLNIVLSNFGLVC